MSRPPFSLVKWYMDCVTDSGTTAILYCAELRWRAMQATYSSILLSDAGATTTQSSMKRHRLTQTGSTISIEFPGLEVAGTWKASAPAVRHTIYEDAHGSVVWNCLQPRSSARVCIGDRELTGLGYAECLTLTLPPWQLPMRHLRWGRFISPQDSLAWIDWQGPYSTRIAVHNDRICEPASISESEVALDDATLHLDQSVTLRSGPLTSTILPNAPALRTLFPHSLFNIAEHKWRSRGTLNTADHQSEGWAIHEVVDWNC